MKRKYNWRQSLPDQRDHIFKATAKKLPTKVDLRPLCSPIVNQGSIGSCTGNALSGALDYLDIQDGTYVPASRLFIYYNERVLEGTVTEDAGAEIRTGIKTLNKLGSCNESTWKYSKTNLFKKPTKKAYAEAQTRTISEYKSIRSFNSLLACLASGYPVAFGYMVYESFESAQVTKTGIMPIPAITERAVGGHAVLAVGYDQKTKMVIVRNSWGTRWGDQGYFYMPFDFISNKDLASDFWMIKR